MTPDEKRTITAQLKQLGLKRRQIKAHLERRSPHVKDFKLNRSAPTRLNEVEQWHMREGIKAD